MQRITTAFALSALLSASAWAISVELSPPAASPSGEPRLFTLDDGSVALSWVEESTDGEATLKFARQAGRGWSEVRDVASGSDWFVNWADTPGLGCFADGVLIAHYLRDLNEENYAYEIRTSLSHDGGRSWGESFRLHEDESESEHGFVSLAAVGKDRAWAVWLDGRKFVEGVDAFGNARPRQEEMTLRAALLASNGAVLRRDLLDPRVCDCCPTDTKASGDLVATVYRDRSDGEIRDISMRIFDGTHWSDAIVVGQDRWKIGGCPVNGPALALDGERAAVAWFSSAEDEAKVQVALGSLREPDFSTAIRIDDGRPLGRVDAVWADGKLWVLWLEQESKGAAVLKLRSVDGDGGLGTTQSVGSCSSDRSSGIPQLAAGEGGLVVIWSTGSEKPRLRGLLVPHGDQP